MVDFLGIIEKLNDELNVYFDNNFRLSYKKGHHDIYVYRIEGNSYALNREDDEPVKVLRWFNDIWLFFEIKFIVEKYKVGNKRISKTHTNISLSVYQGDDYDEKKIQLFRAEWDDMNNPFEKHSQPHWHITSSQAIEKTFEEYSNHLDGGEFISILTVEKSKIFDVKRIHFAMNGNWYDNQLHIHTINNADQVSKWLKGLLSHIRTELSD